jgi:hypothetical protein
MITDPFANYRPSWMPIADWEICPTNPDSFPHMEF